LLTGATDKRQKEKAGSIWLAAAGRKSSLSLVMPQAHNPRHINDAAPAMAQRA